MLLIVDLDGVIYRGPHPLPGMAALLRRREAAGDRIIYATNNSSRHRSEYAELLAGIGAPVSPESVVTSARATALWLTTPPQAVRVALVLGGPGLRRELHEVGIRVVAPTAHGGAARPEAVVVGIDRRLSYDRLAVAVEAIRSGALFVATNRDPVFPALQGLLPGAGALVAAIEVASGRTPVVVGKPEPGLFQAAARLAGVPPASAIVIGDGLATDIAAANRVGARSVLVLSGVTTAQEARAAPAALRPSAVAGDADELGEVLERLAAG